MAWVRLDDLFPEHRKVRRTSDAAFRLHVEAKCWSSRHLTDGHIPGVELEDVTDKRKPERYAAELVIRGMWHTPGHTCRSEFCRPIDDGWLIHDYLDYNPSADQVRAEREAAKTRQRRARQAARERRTNDTAVTGESRRDNGVTHGVVTVPPARPGPSPTPEGQKPSVGSSSESPVAPLVPLPPHLDQLHRGLVAAGIDVAWDLSHTDQAAVAAAIDRVGIPALVKHAKRRHQPHDPAFSAKAFVVGWAALQPRPLAAVPEPAQPCTCGNGYPDRRNCPDCRRTDTRTA